MGINNSLVKYVSAGTNINADKDNGGGKRLFLEEIGQ